MGNVHSFYDAEGRCRVEDISKLIQELQLDVICLQECDGMHLKKLLKLLEQGPNAFSMVWTGDFNALTREDYTEGGWARVTEVRARGAWERPQTEVTSAVRAMGFEDCWATMGRPGPVSTCRFDTHIDYVYLSNPAQETWQCKGVLHHPSNASDHKPVIVKLELKENQES